MDAGLSRCLLRSSVLQRPTAVATSDTPMHSNLACTSSVSPLRAFMLAHLRRLAARLGGKQQAAQLASALQCAVSHWLTNVMRLRPDRFVRAAAGRGRASPAHKN